MQSGIVEKKNNLLFAAFHFIILFPNPIHSSMLVQRLISLLNEIF